MGVFSFEFVCFLPLFYFPSLILTYIYLYICLYLLIFIYIYLYLFIYIYIYLLIYIYLFIYTYLLIFTHTYLLIYLYLLIYTYLFILTYSLILRRVIMYTAKKLMYALASFGASPFLRGRYGIRCIAKGSDIYAGVPWGSRRFCVAGVGQCVLLGGLIGFCILMSFGNRYGIMYIVKGPDVCPGFPWDFVTFAW